jgi:adenylosuccinate synthase
MAGEPFEPLDVDQLVARYTECGQQLAEHVGDTGQFIREAAADRKRVLFEGANGCMLDIDHGTFPYVTSSNTGAIGIYAGAGVGGLGLDRTVGIMKAYTTRVGGGPFPTELHDDIGQRIRDRGKEYGTTTGRPRRCGWLDLVVVRYAARINGVNELAVMLLDVLAGFDELRICTAYELDGEMLTDYPPDAAQLADIKPIYQTVRGFAEDVTGCRSLADLPDAARDYLKLIEQTVGVPVGIVSVGPERSQTLTD